MIIKKIINNSVDCIQIIDEVGEYMIEILPENLTKSEADQKEIALVRYNEIKAIEAQRQQ